MKRSKGLFIIALALCGSFSAVGAADNGAASHNIPIKIVNNTNYDLELQVKIRPLYTGSGPDKTLDPNPTIGAQQTYVLEGDGRDYMQDISFRHGEADNFQPLLNKEELYDHDGDQMVISIGLTGLGVFGPWKIEKKFEILARPNVKSTKR